MVLTPIMTNIIFAVTDFNVTAVQYVVLLFVNFEDISHNVFGGAGCVVRGVLV